VGLGRAIAAADIDGDGHLDLFKGTSMGLLMVALGAGDGTFPYQLAFSAGGPNVFGLVTADFNGDGRPDAIGGTGSGLDVFLNTAINTCY
jgi:hypothetical protein